MMTSRCSDLLNEKIPWRSCHEEGLILVFDRHDQYYTLGTLKPLCYYCSVL
jgi:hypothetical protein